MLGDPSVSIVGSRRPTPAGTIITQRLAGELSALGIVITSGMALGVDGIAHQAALTAGSPTIAVMGCGLDTVYPARHRSLFESISRQGLLLSEYPLGTPPDRYRFPERNRIVSGLSSGVIIVEAAERSGTRITARLAMEQGREVLVVPGSPLNPQYAGSHALIQQGAALVTDTQDVLHSLSIPLQSALQDIESGPQESLKGNDHPLLRYINFEPTSTDQIISASGLTTAQVSSMLLMLEVDGLIAASDDGGYVRLI